MGHGKIAAGCALAVLLSSPAWAAGDAALGKADFQPCAICHNVDKDGGNGVGPNLFGVAGRKAATAADFHYSAVLKASHIVWTDQNLSKWIAGPGKMLPGNKMAYAGVSSKKKIADIVAYLHTLK
ncbi:MAG: c-type cytochrome [Rhizomicrobium sp.]